MESENKTKMRLILASKSPRRRQILADLGVDFVVEAADIGDENRFFANGNIESAIKSLVREKSRPVSQKYPESAVLSADTIVVVDDAVLAKPKDRSEAKEMLRLLSGRSHFVYTAMNLVCKAKNFDEVVLDKTQVFFRKIADDELENYLDTANYADKAGAYGIQEEAGAFVEKIDGEYSVVVGLGVSSLLCTLSRLFHPKPLSP